MRSLLLAALALASTASAQTNNFWGLWTCTNFTSRGNLAGNPGDNMLQVRATHFSGIAHDSAGGTVMTGFRHVLQDQNAATVENYDIIVRADSAGAPDCSATGVLFRLGPIASPGGAGTLAWQLTQPFGTPSTALPACATYYMGLSLGAAGWTADGLSTHMGSYFMTNNVSAAGNPAQGAGQVAHNCLNGAPSPILNQRTYRYEVMTPAAVMNLYNEDPTLNNTSNCVQTASLNRDYGVGGMWPVNNAPARNDGLGVRVDDPTNQNGIFVCFLGFHAGLCPGFPITFLADGILYLNPTLPITPLVQGPLAPTTGRGQGALIPPNTVPLSVVNRYLDFQSFTLGPAFTLPGRLTNRASTQYLP